MSIDILQERIRKAKNPMVLELGFSTTAIPGFLADKCGSHAEALGVYCRSLLTGLKGEIPAVRFHFGAFAVLGPEGLLQLQQCLQSASQLGYYVLVDAPELPSPTAAEACAPVFLGKDSVYPCDGIVISGYLGTDVLKPFLPYCKKEKKSLFVIARTGNKSASELQDLLSGTRLVHMACADQVSRCGVGTAGKSGYYQVGVLAAATSADSLKSLRSKYPGVFLLVDGYDYPNANAKNASFAFDKFGHGAIICAGSSISGAWQQDGTDGSDFEERALAASLRIKKTITKYVTVL